MFITKKISFGVCSLLSIAIIFCACKSLKNPNGSITATPFTAKNRVLVFTKTAGYYHTSIPTGVAAIQKLAAENNFIADTTRDASYFTQDSLQHYNAVIFLSTTLNVLNAEQQVAFERYIQAGGGFAGVHAAADTEYDWPWYNKLVGAWFSSHPRQQKAIIDIVDTTNTATSFLPKKWDHFDEWYNYRNVSTDIKVLANLDETSYEGGTNGDNHPIAWYHEFDGGRAFYTGLGHTNESFGEPLFVRHLLEGIKYAIGNTPLNYNKAYAVKLPEDNRFTKTVLSSDLNEPMELTVAPDGRVFFTERSGKLYVYEPASKQTRLLHNFPAKAVDKYLNGLIGINLDPDFSTNNYIYFFYSGNTGGQYHQNISRFEITADGNLDTLSEKIIIKIPIDLEVSAHTGGSLAWDKNKNLFISTGDNTVPFQSDGYAPLDEREGRKEYDAQRSAGNPNDLRGKILRIHPAANGSYTVPDGNLFAKGTPGTRPEIYVMGCRNPYRISVDEETSYVYWGEVGPDAGKDSRHGPRGYDEFNQAKKPGNFGWPYVVGNNQVYNDSDFAANTVGPLFDLNGPTNSSPNNTGTRLLPAPTMPMIWYPYNRSEVFPNLGDGGRCAMGGPIYHYNASLKSNTKLPAYYNKAWFVYDWMRNWVFAIHMDENNNYKKMDRFMETNGDFRRPTDVEIGPDGAMYMLEYGSVYGIDNEDARLVRIDYNNGNRNPVASITAKDTIGLAPLKVAFSSRQSYDYDEADKLTYSWNFNGRETSGEPNPTFTFPKNGVYETVLTVTDATGKSSTDTLTIKVGNTLPSVTIYTAGNNTFFFPFTSGLLYKVGITDNEDAFIDDNNVKIRMNFIPKVASNQSLVGHQQIDASYSLGLNLINNSDCKACHQMNAKSVGPNYMDISKKYYGNQNAIGILANKIIIGGSGVWGEHAMSAHPQISKEDATEIVKYIVSVSVSAEEKALEQKGEIILNQHLANKEEGRYILMASYTDKGGAITPLTSSKTLLLRPSKVQAEDADNTYNLQKNERNVGGINNGSYIMFKNISLAEIRSVTYRYASFDKDATIEVHADSKNGPLLSSLPIKATGKWSTYSEVTAPITDPGGNHDVYFVFVKKDAPNKNLVTLDWILFSGGKEVVEKPAPAKTTPLVEKKLPVKKALITAIATTTKKAVEMPGMNLIAKSDCKACHAPNTKLVGPSYQQIAAKYKSTPANINKLAGKIINGGAGNWGQIAMAAHPNISTKDASEMVKYILALKK